MQPYRLKRKRAGSALAVLLGLLLLSLTVSAAEVSELVPNYTGSKACAACHETETQAWSGSHHDLAWTLPSDGHVLGDFNDASFEHDGIISRFTSEDGRYFIETDGPDGAMTRYEVEGVAGIAPLQQYLVETEPGRLQALDLAWDVEQERWYHLYPDLALPSGSGLHWSGPYKSWNARCAECHATGYQKDFTFQTQSYASKQAEIGVGCEACHGPGEAHIAWAENPQNGTLAKWQGLSDTGLTLEFVEDQPAFEIELCATCHSRREPLFDASPLPGTPFHDAYRMALLRPGLYHPDGTIQDEVYVYGSFLQSRMHAVGVRCSDCHDPHGAETRLSGNAVCATCHSPAANPRFPSLRQALYDDPAHHFHAPGSAGAQCVSCHMIERTYMGIDERRDHSFRVPRPDLSAETGAPNACNDCHQDQDAAWAAAELAKRFPDSDHRGPHFSQIIAKGRLDAGAAARDLFDIAQRQTLPGIVRATALTMLETAGDPAYAQRALPLLQDPDPLVREAVAGLQRLLPAESRAAALAPALQDPRRAVRISAARAMIGTPRAGDPSLEAATAAAMAEWQESLLAKTDFPETHAALGGTWLVMNNTRGAEQAFQEAVRLDPQMISAWSILVRIRAALGDAVGARRILEQAIAANPGDLYLLSLRTQF